jgi:hypothetical protein
MVHAGVGHLRKAFQRHRQTGVAQTQARILLLFYAVECGLKAAWLTRNKLRSTSAIESQLKENGHDLVFWTRQLHLPATITNGRTSFRLRTNGSALGIEYAHQAWRYGIDVEPIDEAALESWLEHVWAWAKEELAL